MPRKILAKLLLMVSFVFTVTVQAKELKGLQFDDQIEVSGTQLILNGLGVRKAFSMFEVYVGGLYLAKAAQDPVEILASKTPKKVILKFKRFVEKSKMKDAWSEGFLKNADKSYSYKDDLKKLNDAMSAHLKEKDTMSFTFFEDKAVIQLKEEPEVTITGSDFSKTMLKVFLGNPPDEALKKGMLGL